jgi:hypothetical protein
MNQAASPEEGPARKIENNLRRAAVHAPPGASANGCLALAAPDPIAGAFRLRS